MREYIALGAFFAVMAIKGCAPAPICNDDYIFNGKVGEPISDCHRRLSVAPLGAFERDDRGGDLGDGPRDDPKPGPDVTDPHEVRGNPGNHKPVGRAGETPGPGEWGNGRRGKSE